MGKVLIIGAGGVGTVVAHKVAQNPDVFTDIMIASRTKSKCDAIVKAIGNPAIKTAQVDADNVDELVALFNSFKPEIVINVALPYQDLTIMEACLKAGVNYLDTANYEPKDEAHFEYSWQWAYKKRFEDAGLTAGEEQTLESRRKILANASAIRDKIAQSYALLSGDDEASGAVDLLGEASNAVDAAAQLDDALAGASSQLLDLYYNAKDVAADLIGRLDSYDTNDAELDEIEQRLDLIYKLKRKYGDTVEDVIAFGQNAREELERIQSSQERHDHLQAEKLRLYALAREKAEALTQTRLRAFEELNKRISGTLDFLNMPGVRMTLRHTRGPLASHGQDSIEFYISTNPGEAPKPLAKIASGGELSRITLAIKNAMADKDAVPTVIYDEIDSGVSGKAAGRIGEVLRQSAQGHQILCITHTAQIAALADCHLLIQKNVANDRTYTEIHPLDEEGRVEALARLISGDHVTELSRANAREMLGLGAK